MIPVLINKDVFEPSYKDLKYLVWNHNYVYTNLIIIHWNAYSYSKGNLYFVIPTITHFSERGVIILFFSTKARVN